MARRPAGEGAGDPVTAPNIRDRIRTLFPDPPARAVTCRGVALGVLAVIAGAALGLTRTNGPGALDSVWAEDGKNFLTDALNRTPFDAVTTPFNGYFHLLPRLLAEVAAAFPVGWAAAVMSTSAALVAALLAVLVYLAAGAHLTGPIPRLLVAAPLVVAPVGQGGLGGTGGSVINNLATVQFPLLYAVFWVLLWVPASRTGRFLAVTVVLVTALSSPLAVVFVPLAALRLYARRDPTGWWLLGGLGVGALVQFGGLALGLTTRSQIGHTRLDPVWIGLEYGRWLTPNAVLGEHWFAVTAGHPRRRLALVAAAWLIVAAVAVAARLGLTRPRWPLALTAVAASAAMLAVQLATLGSRADRYLYVPGLLLIVALVAALNPPNGRGCAGAAALAKANWPVAALGGLLIVVCAGNWQVDNHRTRARPWDDVVAGARAECAATGSADVTAYTHSRNRFWTVVFPCRRLR